MILSFYLSLFVHLNWEGVHLCIYLFIVDGQLICIYLYLAQSESIFVLFKAKTDTISLERERGMHSLLTREVRYVTRAISMQTQIYDGPLRSGQFLRTFLPARPCWGSHTAKSKKSFFIFRSCRCRAKELFSPAPTLLVVISTLIIHW